MGIKRLVWDSIERLPPLYRLINSLRGLRLHRAQTSDVAYRMATTGYGSWPIPDRIAGGVTYCFGIGRNTVLEHLLSKLPGAEVHLFDPSPISLKHAHQAKLGDWSKVHPYGLSEINGPLPFTDYQDRAITSVLTNHTGPTITLDTKRLDTIVSDLGHSKVDILKLAIEGREFSVVRELLASDMRPGYLFIEFHHDLYGLTKAQTRDAVSQLRSNGYRLFWVSDYGRQYAFIHSAI